MSDTTLQIDVRGELARDPSIRHPGAIAVAVQAGFVTLRGTIASLAERRAALRAVRRCDGVSGIGDRLQLRLGAGQRPRDVELEGAALQALMDDPELPSEWLDAKVSSGWVTLTGDVQHQEHSDVAYAAVAAVDGVDGITNEIVVTALDSRARAHRWGR